MFGLIQRCSDGSYVLLATGRTSEGARAYALRIRPDMRAAVLEARLTSRKRRRSSTCIAEAVASGVVAGLLSYFVIGNAVLSALVAALVAVAVRRAIARGLGAPYLSGVCDLLSEWQPVSGIKFDGRRTLLGRQYNVFTVFLGGSEYHVALTDDELKEISWLRSTRNG